MTSIGHFPCARWLLALMISASSGAACASPSQTNADVHAIPPRLVELLAPAVGCPPPGPAASDPLGYRVLAAAPGTDRIRRDGGEILLDRFGWFLQLSTAPVLTAEALADTEIESWQIYLARCRSSFGIGDHDVLEPLRVDARAVRFEQRITGLGSPLAGITVSKYRYNPTQSIVYLSGHFWPVEQLRSALDGSHAARGIAFAWPRDPRSSFTIHAVERRGDRLLDATTHRPIATGIFETQCPGDGFTCDVWLDAKRVSPTPAPMRGYPWTRRLPSKDELEAQARAQAAASPWPMRRLAVTPDGLNQFVVLELASRAGYGLTDQDLARVADLVRRAPVWFGLPSNAALPTPTRPDARTAMFEQHLANVPVPLGQIRVEVAGPSITIQGHFLPIESAPPLAMTAERAKEVTERERFVRVIHEGGHPCDRVRATDCAGSGPRTSVTRWSGAQMTFYPGVVTGFTRENSVTRIVTVARPPDQAETTYDGVEPASHLPNDWDAVTGEPLSDASEGFVAQPSFELAF